MIFSYFTYLNKINYYIYISFLIIKKNNFYNKIKIYNYLINFSV